MAVHAVEVDAICTTLFKRADFVFEAQQIARGNGRLDSNGPRGLWRCGHRVDHFQFRVSVSALRERTRQNRRL
jgi:hypothetical protein